MPKIHERIESLEPKLKRLKVPQQRREASAHGGDATGAVWIGGEVIRSSIR